MLRALGVILSSMVLVSCANQLAPDDIVRDKDTAITIARGGCGEDIPQKSLDEGLARSIVWRLLASVVWVP